MSIPVLPQASQPAAGIEGGFQGAARVADTVAGVAQTLTSLSSNGQGMPSADQVLPQALGAVGSALGGASTFASGMDPGVSQALGVVSAAASMVGAVAGLARTAIDAIEGAVTEANRHRVTFAFESGALPDATWLVGSFTHEERIGRPFLTTVVLATEDLDLDPAPMLGVNATLMLRRGDDERVLGGLVRRVELGRSTERARVVTVELVPALALLGATRDSRIFQGLDVTEVLDAVVGGSLEAYSRTVDFRNTRTAWKREFCVQYAESTLDFAHRMIEEEGITYFFEWQSDGTERVVFVDDTSAYPALRSDGAAVPFVQQRGETSETEHVHELVRTTELGTTTFALSDLDWTQPGDRSNVEARSQAEGPDGRSRERYDHDRAVTLGPYEGSAYGRTDADTRLGFRRDAHRAGLSIYRGVGNVVHLAPGRTFTLEDHPVAALDGELLVLGVMHQGHAPELHDLFGNERYAASDVSYECRFEAIPKSTPFRMVERTPKPRVHGMLSARVVGASGQEIHSDPHRRVRIQMRWDREGTFDERSSCLVRVLQSWAGPGFGALFLPRVGMEVAVAFLDGDPDRPMVAGCLHDADAPPPYTSEAEWTKSGIRTRTSPDRGAEHFNELTFDDAAGAERVYLRAERDLVEEVEHDHSTHVRRDQTNRVDADQTERVGGSQTLRVHCDRSVYVEGEEDVIVDNRQGTHYRSDHRHIVGGALHQTVVMQTILEHQEARELHVGGHDRESFGAGRETAVTGDDQTSATGRKLIYAAQGIRLGAQDQHEIDLYDGVSVISPSAVRIVVGQNVVSVHSDGRVTVAAKEIGLSSGTASIALRSDGSIGIDGPGGILLTCGSNSVELSTSSVSTSGTSVSTTALADLTIQGAIVRIN